MTPASAVSPKGRDTVRGSIAEGDNIAVGRQADAPKPLEHAFKSGFSIGTEWGKRDSSQREGETDEQAKCDAWLAYEVSIAAKANNTRIVSQRADLKPCPFCGAALGEPAYTQFPQKGLARLHPGSVEDTDCPLSGWGWYDHNLAAWNTRFEEETLALSRDGKRDAGEIARQALFGTEFARTGTIAPVNGSAPYSYVTFHGQSVKFYDEEFTIEQERDGGTAKAAQYASSINDALFALANRAVTLALATPKHTREAAQDGGDHA